MFDVNNAVQLQALTNEINNDPNNYNYAAQAGSDGVVALMLNFVRDGVAQPPAGNIGLALLIKRNDITPSEVLEVIDTRDLPLAVDWRQSWFESATQLAKLRLVDDAGNDTRILGNFKRIITNAQGSQTRLTALSTRNGSRAEQLFGIGTQIQPNDVAVAMGHF